MLLAQVQSVSLLTYLELLTIDLLFDALETSSESLEGDWFNVSSIEGVLFAEFSGFLSCFCANSIISVGAKLMVLWASY